nr:MAG TPA: hypothetical protein [Caudoviricetes sp.]
MYSQIRYDILRANPINKMNTVVSFLYTDVKIFRG